jgi:hypothetical protein
MKINAVLSAVCLLFCISLKGQAPSEPVDLERGLVAWYPFNGNANDESGYGHQGTSNGATLMPDRFGKSNGAYVFTGENNTLSFSGFQLMNPRLTVCGWLEITDSNTDTVLFSNSNLLKILLRIVNQRYQAELSFAGRQIILSDENGDFEIDPQQPRFDFLALSFDGIQLKFRINNRNVAVRNIDIRVLQTIFPYTFIDDIVYSFHGTLDEFRLYDRNLTDEEMEYLRLNAYQLPDTDLQKDLVAYYPFNGNANDESGNGHSGLVMGADLSADRFENSYSAYDFKTDKANILLPNSTLNDMRKASISVWVNWKGERPSIIMSKQNSMLNSYYIFGIGVYSSGAGIPVFNYPGRICFKAGNGSPVLVSHSSVTPDTWYHLVIIIDTDVRLYINGILDNSISGSDFTLADDLYANSTNIGSWIVGEIYHGTMNGKLDDIRIFNRAINYKEVLALFNEIPDRSLLPVLTTNPVYNITSTSALTGGNIMSDGGSPILKKGICWNTISGADTSNLITHGEGEDSDFTSELTNLVPNTYYFARAYAINSKGISYGNEISFMTPGDSAVNLQNGLVAYYPFKGNASDEGGNGLHGRVHGAELSYDRFNIPNEAYIFDGFDDYIEVPDNDHLDFGRNFDFTLAFWIKPQSDKWWSSIISKGTSNSPVYEVHLMYGRVSIGYGGYYDHLYSIYPLAMNEWHFCVVSFSRHDGYIRLFIDGKLNNSINDPNIAYYDLSSNATFKIGMDKWQADDYFYVGSIDDIRVYNRQLTDSEINCLYNTHINPDSILIVSTNEITNISHSFATGGGKILSGGGQPVLSKGICWSTSPIPDTTDFKTCDGDGMDDFLSLMSGMAPFTTYYVRAYAINETSVGYGNEVSFQTLDDGSIDLEKGLIAYYPFNGNANDESGYNHHGIVHGASLAADRFSNPDQAYYFGGHSNSIKISDFKMPSDSTTIACWVKDMGTGTVQDFISKHSFCGDVELLIRSLGNQYAIEWTIGGKFFRLIADQESFLINPDQPGFDFLALAYDGQKVNFYINCQLAASVKIFGDIVHNAFPLTFGNEAGSLDGEGFNGILDDVRVYNRVLNNSELKALYNENQSLISFSDLSIYTNTTFEIPVKAKNLSLNNDIKSYQFDFNYDAGKIQYQDFSLSGTLSSHGHIQVNPVEDKISVAWSDQAPIADSGTLLKLSFRALETGTANLVISNFLFNTDTLKTIEEGIITILGLPTGSYDLAANSIEMYPNPANTMLYFRNLTGNTKISIYDLQGRELVSKNISGDQIDISGLEYGIYTVRIESDETTIIRKLIKQ